jgi:hypothetical protein
MTDKAALYPHRRNKDGSYDSICLTCFAVVACSMAKAELAEKDNAHVCNSALFAERGCLSRAESMRHTARILPTSQRDHWTDQKKA